MYLVGISGLVLGFGIGLRFTVLALLPFAVFGTTILGAIFLVIQRTSDIPLVVLVYLFSLQGGYVISTLLRFVWIGDGSRPCRDEKAKRWSLWGR
jgi:hypothetical protein